MKTQIEVSPEMLAFVGDGPVSTCDWPDEPICISFRLADATFSIHPDPNELEDAALIFVVTKTACQRIFGTVPGEPAQWHLPSDLRGIALSIQSPEQPDSACATFRLAKSIELLCATFAHIVAATLVPVDGNRALTAEEARRIVGAQRLIDERWNEKLTLDGIARTCGLNRAQLTRGYRLMFACSVTDAIAERRLKGARQLLLVTDLPVSSIGYRCGYLNKASFTRAFSRRFGLAPTHFRAGSLVA